MARRDARAPRRAPKQERSEATFDVLLEATRRVVAQGGAEALTMTEIARVAGVAIGTLYHYFPTKDALLAAWEERVLRTVADRFLERAAAAMSAPLTEPATLVRDITREATDALVQLVTQQRFGVDTIFKSRPAIKGELAARCAEVLSAAFDAYPATFRLAGRPYGATLAVKTIATMVAVAVAEDGEAVRSGVMQDELVDMIARYLLADASPAGA